MKHILFLLLILVLLSSCATKKEIIYFQDAELLDSQLNGQTFEPVIESNDILNISISSMNEEVLVPFQRNTGLEGNVNANILLADKLNQLYGTNNLQTVINEAKE